MLTLLALSLTAAASPCDAIVADLDVALSREARCATTALMVALERSRAEGCDLGPALHARGLPSPPATLPPLPEPARGAKSTRDAAGPYPNTVETANFAIKWGANTGFDRTDVDALALAMEHAWSQEVDTWLYPGPYGTDTYKFNVYIGDTGGGAPSSYGAAGYFYYDDDGFPMVVIAASQLGDRDAAATTGAHEFFHAIQGGIATYGYYDQGAWYYEATAVWAEEEIYPDYDPTTVWVFSVAFLPELPVNFFDYPDSEYFEVTEYHQYGAFVFVRHLTDLTGDRDLVRRSWIEAPVEGDPLAVLDDLLDEDGLSIEGTFFDFTARNATWDYEHGDVYRSWIDYYGGYDSSDSHRPTGVLRPGEGWASPAALPPHTYGANYWEVRSVTGEVELSFEGTDGPEWYVAAVSRDGEDHQVTEVQLSGDDGAVRVEGLDQADEAWVVVSAVDGFVDYGTSWSYQLRLDDVDPNPDTGDTGDGEDPSSSCGCSTTMGPGWAVLVLAAAGARRRRRARRRRHLDFEIG